MEKTCDVIIIGAGPAGAQAAYNFAKNGFETIILEKQSLNREKICGGGIFVQEIVEFGPLPDQVIERSIRTLRFNSPHYSRNVHLPDNMPAGVIVKRGLYDCYLQEQAAKAGARFCELASVIDINYRKNAVEVQVSTKEKTSTIKARLLIDASGWSSLVAKKSNSSMNPTDYIASYKCWLEMPQASINEHYGDSIEFFFNSEIIPDGYIWIFPKRDILDVGIGCLASNVQQKKINLKTALSTFIQNHPLLKKAALTHSQGGWIPCRIHPSLVYDRTLLVGDAGGISSPLHGGGIYYARYSGKWAAHYGSQYLLTNQKEHLADYESKMISELYEKDFKWDERMRPFLGDNELVDLLVNSRHKNVDRFFVDLFTGTVPHKKVYKLIIETMQEIIATENPIIQKDDKRTYIPVPSHLTIDAFHGIKPKRILLAISYCLKSNLCPAGKFSDKCIRCKLCPVSELIDLAQQHSLTHYIVTTSGSFMNYLDHNHTGFDRLLAISCSTVANKIALLVNRKYRLEGYTIILGGDVCTTEKDYSHSENGSKHSQTCLDMPIMTELLSDIAHVTAK
ncbi:MAG: hypothetical protein A2X42_03385 [Candidatus Margulisbacteria bacterium GWF2_38_17]|nr:MAG: hypothetical protein A2X42_03385 [Candidatus Margulisbacteria bacterium GWF2_38_17]